MERLSVPSEFRDICREFYTDSFQVVRSEKGETSPCQIRSGIKQGCPLSPLLFNCVVEGLARGVMELDAGYEFREGQRVRVLCFADDLCLVGRTRDEVEALLKRVEDFVAWAGLNVNIRKCGMLSMMNSSGRKYVERYSPMLRGERLPSLAWNDSYKYLGIEVGRVRVKDVGEVERVVRKEVEKVCKSKLCDWQKIEALNTFVLSKLQYALRLGLVNVTWCRRMDAWVRGEVKKATGLPRRVCTGFMHLNMSQGGRGVVSIEEERNKSIVVQLYKVLRCPDPLVREVAWDQLREAVKARMGLGEVDNDDVREFLNNVSGNERGIRDVKSVFSEVRKVLRELGGVNC